MKPCNSLRIAAVRKQMCEPTPQSPARGKVSSVLAEESGVVTLDGQTQEGFKTPKRTRWSVTKMEEEDRITPWVQTEGLNLGREITILLHSKKQIKMFVDRFKCKCLISWRQGGDHQMTFKNPSCSGITCHPFLPLLFKGLTEGRILTEASIQIENQWSLGYRQACYWNDVNHNLIGRLWTRDVLNNV